MLKEKIETLLISTGRKGIDDLLKHMEKEGFYEAPCSSQYHLCKPGGLAEHSLNVYMTACKMSGTLDSEVPITSIVIVSLLHDLGKMGINGKVHYEPNYLKSGEISNSKPYITNTDLLGMPHELLSLQIASKYIELTIEEQHAIMYHNGLYTPLGNGVKGKETPLYMLLHFSDMWASRVIEKEE